MTKIIRETRVEIDAETSSTVFPARVIDGAHWNGWAMPYFTPETARRIAEWQRRLQVELPDCPTYDVFSVSDCGRYITAVSADGLDGREHTADDVWVQVSENVEGLGLPVGDGWTWAELDEDAPHEPAALTAWLDQRSAATAAYCDAWNTALRAAYAAGADPKAAVAAARAATR